ncbi:MAG: hypothetical protein IPN13_07220 [Bacteroidetes bacterium]|nr:hypothetical protein [Bacteroidota bacterium]
MANMESWCPPFKGRNFCVRNSFISDKMTIIQIGGLNIGKLYRKLPVNLPLNPFSVAVGTCEPFLSKCSAMALKMSKGKFAKQN